MKIDMNAHIIPLKYREALYKAAPNGFYIQDVVESLPTLFDLDYRFRIMDKFEGMMQVLTLSSPPVEVIQDPAVSIDLAKRANDEMAELVMKYPDRFAAAVATLPMNDMDAAMIELDRAIRDLKLRGVQIFAPVNDKSIDSLEFLPLYEKMEQYNLPIWIHPQKPVEHADYKTEKKSKYMIFHIFGWPYETTAAMTRIVMSGILEKYPALKIITHHCGGMVPYLVERIKGAYDHAEMLRRAKYKLNLTMPPIEYFKKFYYDTAIYGNSHGLMCAFPFCGADHMLFATDVPYDSQMGERYTRQTIESIELMPITDKERQMIYVENAIKVAQLPL
ncbi:MAG TPA: amidohydrolase family protein [Desulfobacteraceae bacterium]|nr:amidohydrolase family protein [Desulfobacteraceae bacterium]HPJ67887.1 amidohydrolase family protein [Desulfobacteraceae bacterium]HPQ28769.1 amidohydrolase family protein [Desulfobacteraceae bacterium]